MKKTIPRRFIKPKHRIQEKEGKRIRRKRSVRTRAQVSIEFLLIVGFALLMSLPLVYIFFKQSETLNTEVSESQVDKVANEIRDAVDEVYYLGAPSKKTLKLYMPKNINNITLTDNKIIFNVSSPNGNYEVVKWCAGNFSATSEISAGSGVKNIVVEAGTFNVYVSDY